MLSPNWHTTLCSREGSLSKIEIHLCASRAFIPTLINFADEKKHNPQEYSSHVPELNIAKWKRLRCLTFSMGKKETSESDTTNLKKHLFVTTNLPVPSSRNQICWSRNTHNDQIGTYDPDNCQQKNNLVRQILNNKSSLKLSCWNHKIHNNLDMERIESKIYTGIANNEYQKDTEEAM